MTSFCSSAEMVSWPDVFEGSNRTKIAGSATWPQDTVFRHTEARQVSRSVTAREYLLEKVRDQVL
jgi:hypothetical protein